MRARFLRLRLSVLPAKRSISTTAIPSKMRCSSFLKKISMGLSSTGKTVQHSFSAAPPGRRSGDRKAFERGRSFGNPIIGARAAMQFNSRFLSKGGSKHWKLDAHQDWRTGQGSLDSAVIWFPMVDAGADIGALQVIPGSHKTGLQASYHFRLSGRHYCPELKDEDFVQTEFQSR
jgi:phytanoyl-CoA hydroxylase